MNLPSRARLLRFLPNALVLAAFMGVAWQRWPAIRNNLAHEGTRVEATTLESLSGTRMRVPDAAVGRVVLIFWATWCGPCRFELGRFRDAVNAGDLDGARVFAVNMGEAKALVETHAKEARYPFPVLLDAPPGLSARFDVQATPTLVHLEPDGRVASMSTGIGPFSVSRAGHFLAGK